MSASILIAAWFEKSNRSTDEELLEVLQALTDEQRQAAIDVVYEQFGRNLAEDEESIAENGGLNEFVTEFLHNLVAEFCEVDPSFEIGTGTVGKNLCILSVQEHEDLHEWDTVTSVLELINIIPPLAEVLGILFVEEAKVDE